jgi:protein TonB
MIGPRQRGRTFAAALAALGVSGGLHALTLALALPRAPEVLVEGGGGAQVAALGTAFADFAAGATPVAPAPQPPAQPEAVAAPNPPVSAAKAAVPPLTPPLAAPDTTAPDLPSPPRTAAPSVLSDVAAPVTAEAPTAAPAPDRAGPVETTDKVAALPEPPLDPAMATSPRPPARPEARPERADPAPAPEKPKAPAAKPRPAGNAEADARRGSASGRDDASAAAASPDGKAAAAAGNAAAANYPGQVLRQITRLRRPRAPDRGTVVVGFVIAGSGQLASVRVVRSSGSAALDRLAVEHIRRAAPFPPPPPSAQTSFSFEFVGRP